MILVAAGIVAAYKIAVVVESYIVELGEVVAELSTTALVIFAAAVDHQIFE